jgi:hypothetical protein
MERVPFGVRRLKLTVDQGTLKRLAAEKKIPRWVNDDDNRIAQAQAGGYEFVEDSGPKTIKVGDETQDRDRRVKYLVGRTKGGDPMHAYLMAIPEEYYEEDKTEKEKHNQAVDDAIRGGEAPGVTGHGVPSEKGGSSVKNVQYKP